MILFDTNILVYAYDISEGKKRGKCLGIVKSVFDGEKKGFVSNQILGELFYVLTKNMGKPLSVEKSRDIVNSIISSSGWKKINYTHKTVRRAVNYVNKFQIHFWDALIAATMIENEISAIYTENEKDFKKIPGLKVINPLK